MAISNFWIDLITFEEMIVKFDNWLKPYVGTKYLSEIDAVNHLYDLHVDFFKKYPNYSKFSTWIQSEILLEVYGVYVCKGFNIKKLIYTL